MPQVRFFETTVTPLYTALARGYFGIGYASLAGGEAPPWLEHLGKNASHWKTELLSELQKPKPLPYTKSVDPSAPAPAVDAEGTPSNGRGSSSTSGGGGGGSPMKMSNGLTPAYAARLDAALGEDDSSESEAED